MTIFAKKIILISKTGIKSEYTHVRDMRMLEETLCITGETDIDGVRGNTIGVHDTNELHVGFIEFYKPKT